MRIIGAPNDVFSAAQSLTVVVPTVLGREVELTRCLASVRRQASGGQVDLWVSGNGTTRTSSEIAERFGARFTQRDVRLPASEHWPLLLSEVTNYYTWILGDDDVMAPGALETVLEAIEYSSLQGRVLDALIGRAQFFSATDLSDLSPPDPHSDSWKSGVYFDLQQVSLASSGMVHIGAYVYRSDLFKVENHDRYAGTSHQIFGAFWDGLDQLAEMTVRIEDKPLVYLGNSSKQWDHSPIVTLLGLKNYDLLLPEAVSRTRLSLWGPLSHQAALRYSCLARRGEKTLAFALAEMHSTKSFGARSLIALPPSIACRALGLYWWARRQLKRLKRFEILLHSAPQAFRHRLRVLGRLFRRD